MISAILLAAAIPSAVFAAAYKSEYLYAQAQVEGHGIEARVQVTGYTDGRPTTISIEGISGLFDTDHGGIGPYLYHFHTNPITPGDTTCTSAVSSDETSAQNGRHTDVSGMLGLARTSGPSQCHRVSEMHLRL